MFQAMAMSSAAHFPNENGLSNKISVIVKVMGCQPWVEFSEGEFRILRQELGPQSSRLKLFNIDILVDLAQSNCVTG